MSEVTICVSCKSQVDPDSRFCINCGNSVQLLNTQRQFSKKFLPTVIEKTKKSFENHLTSLFVLFIIYIVVLSFASLIYYELFLRRLRLEPVYELGLWFIFFKILLAIFLIPVVYKELEKSDSLIQKIKVISIDFVVSIPSFNSPILTPIAYLIAVLIVHEQLIAIFPLSPIGTQFEFVFYFIFIFISILISIRLSIIVPTMISTKKSVIDSFRYSINETGKEKLGLIYYMVTGNFIVAVLGYFVFFGSLYLALLFSFATIGSPFIGETYTFNLPLIVFFGSFFFIAQLIDYLGRVNIFKLLNGENRK
ncbi:MAG: zinc ribbon domain-containing protein [Candidatus Hodarchaeales archaeon]|jgi:hypothetical protein